MDGFRDYVREIVALVSKAHEDGLRYVFPSQVVARSYLEACARENPGTAVFNDSVVSWDQFKANFTRFPKGRTRAVFTDRLLFVHGFFRKGRAMKRLRFYCDPSYPCSEKAYMKSIATGLPGMCRAFDLATMTIRPSVVENAPSDMVHDIDVIVPAYKAFIEGSGLYDPCLFEPDFSEKGEDGSSSGDYVIVFPGAFSDPYAADALRFCRTVGDDLEGVLLKSNALPKLRLFSNSTAETMACMRRVYGLLASGVLPNDIAISCPNVDAYRPYLEQEALKRDVRLTFADAKPLSQYVPGRFFRALLRVRDENYSMDSMKALLLDPSFPFKDREQVVGIIEAAIRCKIQDGPLSAWTARLSMMGRESLAVRLSQIGEGIAAVVDCRDAAMLHENVMVLVKDLFGEGVWTKEYSNDDGLENENARVFGSCVAELGTLSLHAKLLCSERTPDLFSLFVDILGDKKYAPNTGKDNVRVYGYPLDAGLAVKHHFAIGLTDSNTRVLRNPYPFLPKEKTRGMSDVLQIGDYILGLYSLVSWRPCMASMSSDTYCDCDVWLSSSEEGVAGADVVPVMFLGEGRCVSVHDIEDDSLQDELRLWTEGRGGLASATQSQKDCFEASYGAAFDYRPEPEFAAPSLPYSMGVSRIKQYEACPYKGFATSILKLNQPSFEPKMDDAAQVGGILHTAIQKALKEAGSLRAMSPARLKSIFHQELEDYSRRPDSTDASHIAYIRKRYEDILSLVFSDKTAEPFLDMQFLAMEEETSSFLKEGAIVLWGEADCVLKDDEGYAILDFKKNAGSYYNRNDLDGTSLQLAVYARMLGRNRRFGASPRFGAYYSIEDGKFRYVWPHMQFGRSGEGFEYSHGDDAFECVDGDVDCVQVQGGQGDASQQFVEDNCTRRLKDLSDMIGGARFHAEPKDGDACKNCAFYTLCRGGFETV